MDGETHLGGGDSQTSRPPERKDLSQLCRELNRLGAKYMVVGGFAIIEHGYVRFTGDIDLLVDTSLENEAKIFEALRILPDQAVNELDAGDVGRFTVVRVGDEVLVDLMAKACGITFEEAAPGIEFKDVEGVKVPFPNPRTLLKMKQTVREKDVLDRMFLEQLIAGSEPDQRT